MIHFIKFVMLGGLAAVTVLTVSTLVVIVADWLWTLAVVSFDRNSLERSRKHRR